MQSKPIEIFVYDCIAVTDHNICTVACDIFVHETFQVGAKKNYYPLISNVDVVVCLPIIVNDCVRCTVQQQKGMHINIASPPEKIFDPTLLTPISIPISGVKI